MKKTLLFAVAAAGMLASCSNDETLQVNEAPQQAIGFKTFVNKTTRATSGLEAWKTTNGSSFSVYGGMNNPADGTTNVGVIFENQQVTYNGTAWSYTPLRYWTPGNNYSFSAFAPYALGASYNHGTVTAQNYNLPHGALEDVTIDGNTDLGYDFVTEEAVPEAGANNVGFTFHHLLSKVNVKFENAMEATGSMISVKDVKIKSNSKGTYDFTQLTAYPVEKAAVAATTWTAQSTQMTNTYHWGNATATKSPTVAGSASITSFDHFYLLPGQTQITVEFTANLVNDNVEVSTTGWTHTVTVDLTGDDIFKPGYAYTLVAKLDATNIADEELVPIIFDVVGVDTWENGGENVIYQPE